MNSQSFAQTKPVVYVVAVDGTSASDHVVEVASGLGAALGGSAELHLVHVIGSVPMGRAFTTPVLLSTTDLIEGARAVLDRSTKLAAERFAGRVVGHVGAGEPWREIVQLASSLRADLVVVGTAGRTGVARLALGSVAEQVVRHAGCPVLVARPKDLHAHDPQGIEPPCGECLAVQNATNREHLWCERHAQAHPRGRLHYELPPTFGVGSMNFRP